MRRRTILGVTLLATAFGVAALAPPAKSQAPPKKGNPAEDISFESADGVKLSARFWKGASGKSSTILLLPAVNKDPTKGGWDDLGSELSGAGYNVMRLEWRGHGKSTDITPNMFWAGTPYISGLNKQFVKGADKTPIKNDLFAKDFKTGYYPVLVNDIMAARTELEKRHDRGELNLSSLYLIGAGDATPLGFLYITAEWKREAQRPEAIRGAPTWVTANRNISTNTDPAAKDIAGCIWLSPMKNPQIKDETIKRWASTYAPDMRDETKMLFLTGADDSAGTAAAKFFFQNVLVAKPTIKSLKPLQQTFNRDIKKTRLTGAELLGNDEKFGVETTIKKFLEDVEKERKNRTTQNRLYEKPLPIDIASFGITFGN